MCVQSLSLAVLSCRPTVHHSSSEVSHGGIQMSQMNERTHFGRQRSHGGFGHEGPMEELRCPHGDGRWEAAAQRIQTREQKHQHRAHEVTCATNRGQQLIGTRVHCLFTNLLSTQARWLTTNKIQSKVSEKTNTFFLLR